MSKDNIFEKNDFNEQTEKSVGSENEPNTGSTTDISGRMLIESNMNLLFETMKTSVQKLDKQVISVQVSQQYLYDELCQLLTLLNKIKQYPCDRFPVSENETKNLESPSGTNNNKSVFVYPKQMYPASISDISIDIEEKSRRLLGLKRRLTLVYSILQTVNSRVKKLLLAHDSRMLQLRNKSLNS